MPAEDPAKSVNDLDLRCNILPIQRSLGVYWDIEKDRFIFRVSLQEKPFTRRGVLSIVNSVYDPLGLAFPVVLRGKLILQELVFMGKKANNGSRLGWDDPLPENMRLCWSHWRDSLAQLEDVSVPRCYHPEGFGSTKRREIHAFSDASEEAVGTAVYLREIDTEGNVAVSPVWPFESRSDKSNKYTQTRTLWRGAVYPGCKGNSQGIRCRRGRTSLLHQF